MAKKLQINKDPEFVKRTVLVNREQTIMMVNTADLKLRLIGFRNAVRKTDFLGPLIGAVGLWVPLFTSSFKEMGGVTAEQLQGAYFLLAFFFSAILLKNVIQRLYFVILKFMATHYPTRAPKKLGSNYFTDNETEPEVFVERICVASSEAESDR